MRVAYLVSKYPTVSHTFILREVHGLRARGHEVHTISVRRAQAAELLAERDRREATRTSHLLPTTPGRLVMAHVRALLRAPVAYVKTLAAAISLHRIPPGVMPMQVMYFGEAMLLVDELEHYRIDHVHVHFANNSSDIAMLAVEYGRRCGRFPRRWSMTVHGPTDFYDVGAKRLAAKAAHASRIVCISDFARSQMMGQTDPGLWDKLQIARYGVELPELSRHAEGVAPFTVLNVARLAPVKGQVLLLEAFAKLIAGYPAARLVVVGDGPLRATLERRADELGIASAVELTGPVGQEEIARYYSKADAFCLPSFAEGLPIVLMEAMSFALPVVSTSVMGIPELIRDGVEGLLVPPGRSDALSEALKRVATDQSLRARLGQAARARVERDYTLAKSITQLERVLAGDTT